MLHKKQSLLNQNLNPSNLKKINKALITNHKTNNKPPNQPKKTIPTVLNALKKSKILINIDITPLKTITANSALRSVWLTTMENTVSLVNLIKNI